MITCLYLLDTFILFKASIAFFVEIYSCSLQMRKFGPSNFGKIALERDKFAICSDFTKIEHIVLEVHVKKTSLLQDPFCQVSISRTHLCAATVQQRLSHSALHFCFLSF